MLWRIQGYGVKIRNVSACIRGIFDCYFAPGKAYLFPALLRHLAVNSSRRLLEGRGSLLTVKWVILGIKKVSQGSIQLPENTTKVEPWPLCPAGRCWSLLSKKWSPIVVWSQGDLLLLCSLSWVPAPLFMPAFLTWVRGRQYPELTRVMNGCKMILLGTATVLSLPMESSMEQYARFCLHLCSRESIVLLKIKETHQQVSK